MKISILLPYKENFSPNYAGAVSLFVNDITKISKYKDSICVYGSTTFNKKFPVKYHNLNLPKNFTSSQSKSYIEEFVKQEKIKNSNLIEIHNRPTYLSYLIKEKINSKFILYFHNDPLTMRGSKTQNERIFLIKNCSKIIFNSQWSKKRFLNNIKSSYYNSEKLIIIYQSANKQKINFLHKKKWITFVGKLNKAKGFDIFGKAVIKILNKYPRWKAIVIGDERRESMLFKHKNLKLLGFQKHNKVLNTFKNTSIAVVCSRWDEPLGRTSLEASSNGCAVIISNRGGLPETITNGIILKYLNEEELYNEIEFLIKNNVKRKEFQRLSNKNFILTNKKSSKEVDVYRDDILIKKKFLKNNNNYESLRILHITNFNERHNGRLFFNTGRRINNGFIRLGHSVLELSDRDILKNNKSITDLNGSKKLNSKILDICNNFRPNLIVLGHADLVDINTLADIKNNLPNIKIAQWFLDPLNKDGPDFNKNKSRILNKLDFIDASFLTTSPKVLKFINNKDNFHFIPNPTDPSFERLNNFNNHCEMDVFYAISHGVHRGNLKIGKYDERQKFLESLIEKTPGTKFDIYGLNKIQPIWGDSFLKAISNSKMGLNLSRGEPIKYYSSDRIAQIIGNGLLTLIDEKTHYRDFFSDNEMVFYKNIDDLSEKIMKYKNGSESKKIAENGKKKYTKYFNSNLVADFILTKTLGKNSKNKFIWNK
ncbi:glycosyltransferase [Candidatus Pelagibacter sp.]|nr:glycosyltransferase [Candidatus Pelagibacter sp.]